MKINFSLRVISCPHEAGVPTAAGEVCNLAKLPIYFLKPHVTLPLLDNLV